MKRGWTWFQGIAAICIIRHNDAGTTARDEVFNFDTLTFDALPEMITKAHVKVFKKIGLEDTLFNACQWADIPTEALVDGAAVVPVSVDGTGLPINHPGSTNDCIGIDTQRRSFTVTFSGT